MKRYIVCFTSTVEYSIEVEALDEDHALDAAHDQAHFPFIPAGMRGEVSGDWEVGGVEEIE